MCCITCLYACVFVCLCANVVHVRTCICVYFLFVLWVWFWKLSIWCYHYSYWCTASAFEAQFSLWWYSNQSHYCTMFHSPWVLNHEEIYKMIWCKCVSLLLLHVKTIIIVYTYMYHYVYIIYRYMYVHICMVFRVHVYMCIVPGFELHVPSLMSMLSCPEPYFYTDRKFTCKKIGA